MQTLSRVQAKTDQDPIVLTTIRILQFVAMIGGIYCMLAILEGNFFIPFVSLALYGTWFLVCVESCEAMIHNHRWGVYLLGLSTLIVTIVDILRGKATIGGAALGLVVLALIIAYLNANWHPSQHLHTFDE